MAAEIGSGFITMAVHFIDDLLKVLVITVQVGSQLMTPRSSTTMQTTRIRMLYFHIGEESDCFRKMHTHHGHSTSAGRASCSQWLLTIYSCQKISVRRKES
jgi:hypothetical protein